MEYYLLAIIVVPILMGLIAFIVDAAVARAHRAERNRQARRRLERICRELDERRTWRDVSHG